MSSTFDAARRFIGAGRPPPPPAPKPAPKPAPGGRPPPPTTKPPTAPPPGPKPPTPIDQSARALLDSVLDPLGLSSLSDWAWQTYTQAGGGTLGIDLVNAQLPQQAAFKQRFPAIAERVAKGLPAMSPADYINYESTIRQAFSAHGLPLPQTGADFNSIITGLLVNDVSAAEVVNQRIGSAFDRVINAPIEVRQAAESLWGVHGDKALAAFFLDPNRSAPLLERLSQQAEIKGTAARFGIDINADRADRLQTLGADQQLGQFSKLATLAPLFAANAGEDPSMTEAGAGVSAVFGENADAGRMVQQRLDARRAALSGSGQPYTQSSLSGTPGESGLGTGPV